MGGGGGGNSGAGKTATWDQALSKVRSAIGNIQKLRTELMECNNNRDASSDAKAFAARSLADKDVVLQEMVDNWETVLTSKIVKDGNGKASAATPELVKERMKSDSKTCGLIKASISVFRSMTPGM